MTQDEATPKTAEEPALEEDEGPAIVVKRTPIVRNREWWVGWTTVWANFASIIASVLVPLSIAIAAYSVYMQTQEQRRSAAAQQVNLFYSQGLANAQSTLFSLWNKQDLAVLKTPQPRKFIDAFVDRTIRASDLNPEQVTTAIVSITAYFDRVEGCIDGGRCDEGEVLSQIGRYGRDFHCLYAGQIERLREETVILHLGDGLSRFAARTGGCGAPVETTG